MARRLAQRVVHLVNMPLRLNLPAKTENITEFSLRTVQSANKIEIKRVLQSVYGLKVSKVNTINYDGKRKRRTEGWMAKSAPFKKAYVILQEPVSLPRNLFPFNLFKQLEEEKQKHEENIEQRQKSKGIRRNSSNAHSVTMNRHGKR
ncbi:hypothetical protein KP509_03G042300 [Ceratopteris richardii]|uniref:Large ribosomal subunit protein uL23m n=1 Tax=Ceratopteris richardii TaxID=49495 RepID=A0A8T2UZC4_CERRI|nr:hypothetical protein KP509_03G042300 [Ceratopteris richardii]KAH7441537.1 hypothetical protein KP509_03G042300 [Ceratopteris richardii]